MKFMIRVKRVSSYDEFIVEADTIINDKNIVSFYDKEGKMVYSVSVFSLIDYKPTEWSPR